MCCEKNEHFSVDATPLEACTSLKDRRRKEKRGGEKNRNLPDGPWDSKCGVSWRRRRAPAIPWAMQITKKGAKGEQESRVELTLNWLNRKSQWG